MRRKQPPPPPAPRSMVASAARISLNQTSWRHYRLQDQQWQHETWRLYDSIGEFRFSSNYVGSAVSRVRLYVAEVDEHGRVSGELEDDDQVQAIADTLFGGPSAKSEILRLLGVSLMVAGECFLIGRAGRLRGEIADSDKWFVVSPGEMRRGSGVLSFRYNNEVIELNEGRDIVIRLWTPHPAHPDRADSPARSALPILILMEQLIKYMYSQIDSRLASAGLLPIPNNIDFPREDGDNGGVKGLMDALIETGTESLQGAGSAAGVFPILVEMSPEAIASMPDKPITFESVLSEHAPALMQEAIRRLATSLDMPPEVLEGAGDTNHWGIWYVEENAIKIHVEPLMTRIVDALTEAYLKPALRRLGKDVDRYVFWYDTAPLTNRPNRLQDTLNLYERGIVSEESVLRAGNYHPSEDAATEDEKNVRFVKELMLRDPSLFAISKLRELIGIEVDIVPELPPGESGEGQEGGPGPPPPPTPQRRVDADTSPTGQLPSQTQPKNQTQQPSLVTSAELVPGPTALLVASNMLTQRALEKAGGKLLTRAERGRWPHVPKHQLHTRIRVRDQAHAQELLGDAWDMLPEAVSGLDVDPSALTSALDEYAQTLLVRCLEHSRGMLREVLKHRGLE